MGFKKTLKNSPKFYCFYNFVKVKSLQLAIQEQGLEPTVKLLKMMVPDVSDQYTHSKIDTDYLELKVRGLHAFQYSLTLPFLNKEKSVYFDFGDSSGNHALYFKGNYITQMSFNVDKQAVKKIKDKGLSAEYFNLEEQKPANFFFKNITAVLFEVLEHLDAPAKTLSYIRQIIDPKYLIITVPYRRISRVVAEQVKRETEGNNTEDTHVFELCPSDWKKLFNYSGWEVKKEQIYKQYPWWLWPLAIWWRWFDFEGFYGAVLVRKGEKN